MTTMISEVYQAFRKAGVPEEEARSAAEALSAESIATKGDIQLLDKKIDQLQAEIVIVKWMLGVVIAAVVIPLIKSLIV